MQLKIAALAAALALSATAAHASRTLDFENGGQDANVSHFYNGGTDSSGASGPDYGVTVVNGRFNNDPTSLNYTDQPSGIGVLGATDQYTIFNLISGFGGEFSFNYLSSTSAFASDGVVVGVYDGLDGMGNLLASITLSAHECAYNETEATSCDWAFETLKFSGLAKSAHFTLNAATLVLDDVSFGDVSSSAVPEPTSWAMMIIGFGLAGGALRRRRDLACATA